ncbi:tautomerase family protein [Streptomyces sp. NPDC050504]|uniref:tautomerase family protein n=1 Tax=Streptomyces sp. NPDC050504 TaxID=3365618 RepID=UPI0037A70983
MPHVTIKHFPKDFTPDQERDLADELTALIAGRFGTSKGAVSIALEAVAPDDWHEAVYAPEIEERAASLLKFPDYEQK